MSHNRDFFLQPFKRMVRPNCLEAATSWPAAKKSHDNGTFSICKRLDFVPNISLNLVHLYKKEHVWRPPMRKSMRRREIILVVPTILKMGFVVFFAWNFFAERKINKISADLTLKHIRRLEKWEYNHKISDIPESATCYVKKDSKKIHAILELVIGAGSLKSSASRFSELPYPPIS